MGGASPAKLALAVGCSLWTMGQVTCGSPRVETAAIDLAPAPPATASSGPQAHPVSAPLDAKRLERISVKERRPAVAKQHRDQTPWIALDTIREAIERADADMFVRYVETGKALLPPTPFGLDDSGHFVPWPDGDVSQGVLAHHGGTTFFCYAPSSAPFVLSYMLESSPLADGSPGLVWEAERDDEDARVTFVSLDGETYAFDFAPDAPSIAMGPGPTEGWPGVANPAFGRMAFTLGRRAEITPLAPVDEAFERCAERAWARALVDPAREPTQAELAAASRAVRKSCNEAIGDWENVLAENIDASIEERTALYEMAKARVAFFGLDR